MHTTPVSLLERLRRPGEAEAWERFVELYTPLLYHWARHVGLQDQDAADLVQDVFTILVQKMPEFTYDQHKSFRGWLRTVTMNRWRDNSKRRGRQPLPGDEAALANVPAPEEFDGFWEAEYRGRLIDRALHLMQAEFQPATWQACWKFVVEGRPAAEVAAELGLTENAVWIAKCRVLRRLRRELEGLMD
jgi:RNA polymerase sigma-70 factor (ECF subfamily)